MKQKHNLIALVIENKDVLYQVAEIYFASFLRK